MKCNNCGLPLSPNNSQIICPRCHATTQAGSKSTLARTSQSFDDQGWNGQDGQAGLPNSPWGQAQPVSYYQEGTLTQVQPPSSPLWNTNPQHAQLPFPQPGQLWQSTPPPTPIATPKPGPYAETYGGADAQTSSNAYMAPPHNTGAMYPPSTPPIRPLKPRTSNFGFFVATLFVITGGLMLAVVYVMALGLPQTNATSASLNTPQSTQSILPSPTTAKTPIVSPTPTTSTLPGQSYIDNAQMASAVNINTAQPLQTTTTFQTNKKIYVTFAIHPNGKSGAVCLYWYLNNHNITQYPFSVTDTANAGYSFAVYESTGAAFVNIYWASTITCSDKILAQHVTFTVKA